MTLGVGFGGIGLQGGARTVGDLTAGPLTLTDDANAGGKYLLNEQTTTNMMSKGTVYKFIDGATNYLTVGNVSDWDGFSSFAVHVKYRPSTTRNHTGLCEQVLG
jgi:hypothetical protein